MGDPPKKECLQLFQKILLMIIRHTQWEKNNNDKKALSLPSLPMQTNLPLPSTTADLLCSPSATANLYNILRAFTPADPWIDKFKFGQHPRYIVIVEGFLNQSDVTQMSL